MKLSHRRSIALAFGLLSLLVMISPVIPFQALAIAGERPPAPPGYHWCLGYQFLEDRLVPSENNCPSEYLCMSQNRSFTTKEEARGACPNEWVESVAPIVEETPQKDTTAEPIQGIAAVGLVASVGYLFKTDKKGKWKKVFGI